MTSNPSLEVRLLGPLEVRLGDARVGVRGRRPRTLLCILALAGGRPVSADVLVDRIWGESELPSNVRGSLHTYVHRLRSTLGVDSVVAGDGVFARTQLVIDGANLPAAHH